MNEVFASHAAVAVFKKQSPPTFLDLETGVFEQ